MKTEIYLVRHGQTEWNLQKRYQGSGDSPLTELGLSQAKALASHLKDIHFDAFFCSPAGRAQTTANIIKGTREQEIEIINNFKEINLELWEGQLYDDTKNSDPKQYDAFWHSPDLFKPLKGESFSDITNRTYPTLLKLANKYIDKRIIIVSHAVAIKSILNKINGLPLKRFWENKLFQTSVSVLEYENNQFKIMKYGNTDHLNDLKNKNSSLPL